MLCAAILWPGVNAQANLDAKWANAIAAIGVALAFVLSVRGARPIAFAAWSRGDRWRAGLAGLLVLVSLRTTGWIYVPNRPSRKERARFRAASAVTGTESTAAPRREAASGRLSSRWKYAGI